MWSTGGELTNLFQNHEVVAAMGWPLMTNQLRKLNFPVGETIPKENTTGWIDHLMVTAGSENKELAQKFLEYMIEAQTQKKVTDITGYTPANPQAAQFMTPEEIKACISTTWTTIRSVIYFWQNVAAPRQVQRNLERSKSSTVAGDPVLVVPFFGTTGRGPSQSHQPRGLPGLATTSELTTSATSSSTAPLLDIRKVAKSFGKNAVLRDISLEVAEGEFLTILGESGSGKTTLLRIIAGFESATSGEILDGRRATRHSAAVPAPRQHRLPALCPVPASDGRRERRLRTTSRAAARSRKSRREWNRRSTW